MKTPVLLAPLLSLFVFPAADEKVAAEAFDVVFPIDSGVIDVTRRLKENSLMMGAACGSLASKPKKMARICSPGMVVKPNYLAPYTWELRPRGRGL